MNEHHKSVAAIILLNFGLVALTLAWLLPGHYPPWAAYQQQWLAALGTVLIAATALIHCQNVLQWSGLASLAALFALVPPIQYAAGQLPFVSNAIMPALFLLAFAGSVVTGAALTRCSGQKWIDSLMGAVVIGALVSTTLALLQWLGLGYSLYIAPLPAGGRPYANFQQPNHLATLVAMGVAGVLRSYEQRRLGAIVAATAVTFLGFGLVMTESRTGWLFVAVLACWWVAMRRKVDLRLSPAALIVGVAIFIGIVAVWIWQNEAALISAGVDNERLQVGARPQHWLVLLDAVARAPLFGYGWLQVATAQQAAALFHPATHEMLQDSHNVIIDLCVWMGVPLALLMVGGVLLWLITYVRRCGDPGTWALLLAVGAVLTHALLEYPLDYAYFLLPLGLIMGSIEGAVDTTPADRPVPRWRLALPLLGMSVMLVWIGIECVRVEDATRQLRFVVARIGIDRVPTAPLPDVVLLDESREIHRFWVTPIRTGLTARELDSMRLVMQHNAAPATILRYALATGLNGRQQEAARALALICKIYPVRRCDEGRASWLDLQRQHSELSYIAFPGTSD